MMKNIVHNSVAVQKTVMDLKLKEDILKSSKLVISVDEGVELADPTEFQMTIGEDEKKQEEGRNSGKVVEMTNLSHIKNAHATQL